MIKSFDRIGDLSTRVFALCGKTGEGLMTGPRHVAGEANTDPGDEVVVNIIAVRTARDSITAC